MIIIYHRININSFENIGPHPAALGAFSSGFQKPSQQKLTPANMLSSSFCPDRVVRSGLSVWILKSHNLFFVHENEAI